MSKASNLNLNCSHPTNHNTEASTPMREGGASGNFHKIYCRTNSLGLNLAYEGLLLRYGLKAPKDSLNIIAHIGLRKLQLIGSPPFSMFFHRAIEIASTTEVLSRLLYQRSQVMEETTNYYAVGPWDTDGTEGLVDTEGLIGSRGRWTEVLQ
jgi:hypothetical protein